MAEAASRTSMVEATIKSEAELGSGINGGHGDGNGRVFGRRHFRKITETQRQRPHGCAGRMSVGATTPNGRRKKYGAEEEEEEEMKVEK